MNKLLKRQVKRNLSVIVATLLNIATYVVILVLLKNPWIAMGSGVITSLGITYILAKTCAKNVMKIIGKGQKFWFYYLMSTSHDLLNEEQEILLVSHVNEGSERHTKMLEHYLEKRYLCKKAEELLKKVSWKSFHTIKHTKNWSVSTHPVYGFLVFEKNKQIIISSKSQLTP